MRNINLLPRKNYVDQNFMPLLVVMITAFIALGFVLLFYSFNNHSNINAEQQKIEALNRRISKLNALHQVDPRTQDFNTFTTQVKLLKDGQRDWLPIVDLISTNLFKSSRLISINVTEKDGVTLQLHFASLQEVADYSVLLQDSPLIEQISIKSITQTKETPQVNNGTSVQPNVVTPTTANPVSTENILKSLQTGETNSPFEGDQLLNQLQAIINKQSVKQQFGIDLQDPQKNTKAPDSIFNGTPFSQQEIEDAQKSLNEFKQKNVMDNSTAQPSVETQTPQVPSLKNSKGIIYYSVTLNIQLKALPQGK